MSKAVFRIALAQINAIVGDLSGNADKIVNFIRQAQSLKADVVTFPELAICGYPPEDLLLKRHFIRDNLRALETVIKKSQDIIAIVGFVSKDKENNLYNAAGIIQDGKLKAIYRKMELPNYGVFDEKRYFQAGSKPGVFNLRGVKCSVNICEDIWAVKWPARRVDEDVRLIINVSASPYYSGKVKLRERMLRKRAEQRKAYVCYNNLVGAQDELVFDGASIILNPKGKTIAYGKQFAEDLIVADLPIKQRKRRIKYLIDRPSIPQRKHQRLDKIAEIYSALLLGTQDYIRKNGFHKVVVGLSGGIDSALTAAIACDAVGSENVIGVSMPSRYSSNQTQNDAKKLADNLGIRLITTYINSIYDIYLAALEKEFTGLKRDVTEENIQARIRGNILMALSNKFGWLVLTTGNKSETSVGYCTLYGDMAGGFAIIKDVTKTRIYELAKFRNKIAAGNIIPKSIIKRAPTAELKFEQKDRDLLPAYPLLDKILTDYIEEDRSPEAIIARTKNPKVVRKIVDMVDRNEYKRRQSPPGIKITPKAFGKDRRLPITNRYREY